mgnify:CR=1 FL=1
MRFKAIDEACQASVSEAVRVSGSEGAPGDFALVTPSQIAVRKGLPAETISHCANVKLVPVEVTGMDSHRVRECLEYYIIQPCIDVPANPLLSECIVEEFNGQVFFGLGNDVKGGRKPTTFTFPQEWRINEAIIRYAGRLLCGEAVAEGLFRRSFSNLVVVPLGTQRGNENGGRA